MPFNANKKRRFHSLRSKVFYPFALIVLVLLVAAIFGSLHLADLSFKNSTDQRLTAAQEVLYREFKKQETILNTYAVIMQQFHTMSYSLQDNAELGILQDRLYNILEESDISTAFYPADIVGIIEQKSLIDLFNQVRRSSRARFRYSNEFGGVPVLMVAAPIFEKGEMSQVILLQTVMGDNFLHNITESLNVDASLLTLDGQILAKSDPNLTEIALTPAQMSHIGGGQSLFLDHSVDTETERHLFSIIPLGSSDLVLLSLEASLKGITEIQKTTILRMIIAMVIVIIILSLLYFRLVNNITMPIKELILSTEAISRGDLNYRIVDVPNDELGQIAMAINQMATDLESSYCERANHDITAALAKEEDKTRLLMERKEQEQKKLNDELRNIQRETSALFQLNQAMTAAIDLGALFDRILQVLNETICCDHIVLLVHNPGERNLEVMRTSGLDADLLMDVRFSFNQGITGLVAQNQATIYVKDLNEDERNLSYHGQVATRGSMVSTPLLIKGRLVGVINLHKKQVDAFTGSEQKLIQAVANQTAIAIDNAQLVEKSRELSNTDDLTGLANRRHFQDILKREVAQARRFNTNFSIIMCDIDGYAQHKSSLGNISADVLLRQIAQLLLKSTRGIDLVCRFGKDQFTILLPKTFKGGGVSTAEKLRQRINGEDFSEALGSHFDKKITLSYGVTEFPLDSKNIYELLNLADRALYAAKREGGDRIVAWEGPAPEPE